MEKIVCDTNILISALIFPGGKPDQVIKLAQMGKVKLFISPPILLEFRKVVRTNSSPQDPNSDLVNRE